MRFKKGDLVTGYKFRLRPLLLPPLHLRPRLRLRPRAFDPLPSDYGIVVESIDKKDAWEDFNEYTKDEQAQLQHCYVVHWQRTKEASLIYENEIRKSS